RRGADRVYAPGGEGRPSARQRRVRPDRERQGSGQGARDELVPRTRSSRMPCREFDCELRAQRGTRIIELLVVLDSEVRKRGCRTNDANFGIGPLGRALSMPTIARAAP